MITNEDLHTELRKIGFKIKGFYPNTYIFDYLDNKTNWRVLNDRIENEKSDENVCICFYFSDMKLEILDNNCVAISAKDNTNIFALFTNYTMER